MCLYTTTGIKTASEDITVYKIVRCKFTKETHKDTVPILTDLNIEFVTPYQGSYISRGPTKAIGPHISENNGAYKRVFGGYIHVCKNMLKTYHEYIFLSPYIQNNFDKIKGYLDPDTNSVFICKSFEDMRKLCTQFAESLKVGGNLPENYSYICALECTVPKGTEFYENEFEIASRKIIYPD